MTTRAFATKPADLARRRFRSSEIQELVKTHEVQTEPVSSEEMSMFTLASLLVLGGDLKDALDRYNYSYKYSDASVANSTLLQIDNILVDMHAHIEEYFIGTVFSLEDRQVSATIRRGRLVNVRVIGAKWTKRLW